MNSERVLNPAAILGFAKTEAPRKLPLEEVVVEAYVSVRPALLSYLHHIVGSTGEAEDVVQITFLKLFDRRIRKFWNCAVGCTRLRTIWRLIPCDATGGKSWLRPTGWTG
jgi:hypothetical protein